MEKPSTNHARPSWIRKHGRRIIVWSIGLGTTFALIGGLALLIFAAVVSRDLPNPDSLSTRTIAQSTKIYDRTGQVLLYEIHGDERRTLVPIEQIPLSLQHATVAIEDRKFYEHHGVDWMGLVRAVVRNAAKGQGPKGTSTLTQQLVRNTIISNERNYLRKLKEMILALQIERTFTKDQVLQMYLNEVPYGSTLYGAESAAQTYFGKSARDLALDESALLASIPQAPDRLSPYGTGVRGDNRDQLVARQTLVLEKMAEQGFITQEEAREAIDTDTLAKLQPQRLRNIRAPHFSLYVRELLTDQFAEQGGMKFVEQGGLKVITSLDWDKQEEAEKLVSEWVQKNGSRYNFNNAALVSVDPKTGEIVSMVGSADYFNKEIRGNVNVIMQGKRQPGSSFKPIVYAAAFEKGYLPQTEVFDSLTSFPTDGRAYEPRNYNLREYGPVSLRKALQGSLNISAVKVLYLVGVGRALDFGERLGYTTLTDRSRFGLAVVLGGAEVLPIDHAHAFSAFANDGEQAALTPVLRVETPDGKTLFEAKPQTKRVIEQQTARLLNNVMTDNEARAYVFGSKNSLTLPDRPVATKTGTTNNYVDAWTVGYTPNLVGVVWVGNTDNKPMKQGADSSSVAAPLWQSFMKMATENLPKESFPAPEPPETTNPALLGQVFTKKARIDKITGLLANEFTPAEAIEERSYIEPHDILFYLDKDDPLGPAPTNPASDPHFAAWERSVAEWADRSKAVTTAQMPTVSNDQIGPAFAPIITILTPFNQAVIDTSFITINVEATAPRGVQQMQIRLGETVLGTVQGNSPSFGVILPPEIPNGYHDLVITARDDVGNAASQLVTILLQRAENTETPPQS